MKTNDRKTMYNTKNNQDVTNDVMFVYAHEKIKFLVSVFSIVFFFFFFFFYDFNLKTQSFVILKFVKDQLVSIETCEFSQNAMFACLLYN